MHTQEIFRLLSDSTRLRCLRILTESPLPLCVAEITDILQKPQYAVSRALGELRKGGLVKEGRQGQLRLYELDQQVPGIVELGRWIAQYCECDFEADADAVNPDGSTQPGYDSCAYDSERLSWRIRLRQLRPEILTSRPQSPQSTKVLFVCVHNSARSQFAEAYLNRLGGPDYLAESAGLQAGTLNPGVVQVLQEQGIDIRAKQPREVAEVYALGRTYDWIITVCDPEAEKNCPVFPGPVNRLSWPFPDPSNFQGSQEEVLNQVRELGEAIRTKVQEFVNQKTTSVRPRGAERIAL